MVTRVEWTRMSGDEVEDVIAIMLLREHRAGHHIRPSTGDGGIDVVIPDVDAGSVSIYQIKKFATNLASTQKRQIQESIERLRNWVADHETVVSTLYLTVPLNPTHENLEWLDDVRAGCPFEVEWFGLSRIEGLVADHERVVDYYLHGGRGRLDASVASLNALLRTTMTTSGSGSGDLQPAEVAEQLSHLQDEISCHDPFYEYEFTVSVDPPAYSARERAISFVTERMPLGNFVTVITLARFPDAPNWSPATIEVRAEPASLEEEEAFKDFVDYGLSASVTAEFSSHHPGGLSAGTVKGIVTIGPTEEELGASRTLRWDTVDETGTVQRGVLVNMTGPHRGLTPDNSAFVNREQSGVFTSTWRFNGQSAELSVSVEQHDLSGRPAQAVEQAVSFLSSFGHPNRLRVSPEYGPPMESAQFLPRPPLDQWSALAELVAELVELQQITSDLVIVPPLETLDVYKRAEVRRCVRLVRGEEVRGKWGGSPFSLILRDDVDVPSPGEVMSVRYVKELRLRLGPTEVHLGHVLAELHAAMWNGAAPTESDGQRKVFLVPVDEDRLVRMQRGALPAGMTAGQVLRRRLGWITENGFEAEAGDGPEAP